MLLILAGVALTTLTGQGNIIGNAENAVGKYNNSVATEQQLLNEIEKYFQNYLVGGNGDNPPTPPDPVEPPKVDSNGLATENVTIKPDPNSDVQIVIPTGFAPAILATGTTQSGPGEDGEVAHIMPYEQWNRITVEDINQGIVIVDHAKTYDNGQTSGTVPDFNEFVWVSIPDEDKFNRGEWEGPYYNGNVTSGIHPLSDKSEENKFWEDTTETEYVNMKDSVIKNKGFYIGRYEASQGIGNIAQSKRNIEPWAKLNLTTAKTACINNKINDNMHLIYGIEWDSTLNWLIDKAKISTSTLEQIKTVKLEDIQADSCSWGIYLNSTGGAATGDIEYLKANNIYNLAGNYFEITQENYSIDTLVSIRGGNLNCSGNYAPAAERYCHNSYSEYVSFRMSFYV